MFKDTIRNGLVLALVLAGLTGHLMSGCSGSSSSSSNDEAAYSITPRHVIFMVPDGMGLADVTAARIYMNGLNNGQEMERLAFETLPYIGYQRTHAANATVTDSAAASSAWAGGEKFDNGAISCHDHDHDGLCDHTRANPKTILEHAKAAGLSTGLVVTGTITHATPAGFSAHVYNRNCECDIFDQEINQTGVDVLLGGGVGDNNHTLCKYGKIDGYHIPAAYSEDGEEKTDESGGLDFPAAISKFIEETVSPRARGYRVVTTKDELFEAVAHGTEKIWGRFGSEIHAPLTPAYRKGASNPEPTLAELTTAALEILDNNPAGFFLMVEGSLIDRGSHYMNLPFQIGEVLGFSDAVRAVRDWIDADEKRAQNTLLIVVADHECGGFSIKGPSGSLAKAGDSSAPLLVDSDGYLADPDHGTTAVDEDGETIFMPDMNPGWGWRYGGAAGHTAEDTLIWSNSRACSGPKDNTDLYGIMRSFLDAAE